MATKRSARAEENEGHSDSVMRITYESDDGTDLRSRRTSRDSVGSGLDGRDRQRNSVSSPPSSSSATDYREANMSVHVDNFSAVSITSATPPRPRNARADAMAAMPESEKIHGVSSMSLLPQWRKLKSGRSGSAYSNRQRRMSPPGDRHLANAQQQHRRRRRAHDSSSSSSLSQVDDGGGVTSSEQRRLLSQIVVPPARSGAASVVVGSKMYMFGGYGGSGRLDDFYEYSFETQRWKKLPTHHGNPPGFRENNGMVFHKGSLYLFGGYTGSRWLNDFHCYNIEEATWRKVEPKGTPPSPRFGNVSAVWGDSFVCFAGYNGSAWLNDLYVYDFVSEEWSCVKRKTSGAESSNDTGRGSASGDGSSVLWPSIRSCPSWTQRGKNVYIFGGYDGVQRMNDFYVLHMDSFTWSKIECRGVVPSPRYFHASVIHDNVLYVFGGYDGVQRMNDMHQFDFDTGQWSFLQTSGERPCGRSSIVAVIYRNTLKVFGGYSGRVVLDDFFEFRFRPIKTRPGKLVADLRKLINNPDYSDVTFVVGDTGERLYATRAILAARSEHFQALLYGGMRESVKNAEIPLVDVRCDVFLRILEFLYTDQLTVRNTTLLVLLLSAAERYLLPRLKELCEDSIRRRIEIVNVVEIFMAAHANNASGLREICFDFIIDNLSLVKETEAFQDLKSEPDLLMEIVMSKRPSCE